MENSLELMLWYECVVLEVANYSWIPRSRVPLGEEGSFKSLTGDIGTTPMPENSLPRSKLGTLLERAKAITMNQLIHALNMHKSVRMRLGEYLVTYGYISEEQLARALAEQFGLPFVDLAKENIETFYAKMIPKEYALQYEVLPISHAGGKLTTALADPTDKTVLQKLKTITGLSVVPVIATTSAIHDAINRVFH